MHSLKLYTSLEPDQIVHMYNVHVHIHLYIYMYVNGIAIISLQQMIAIFPACSGLSYRYVKNKIALFHP